jgi:acyl carrier protein
LNRRAFPWQHRPHPFLQRTYPIADSGAEYRAVFHHKLMNSLHSFSVDSAMLEMAVGASFRSLGLISMPRTSTAEFQNIELGGDASILLVVETDSMSCQIVFDSGAIVVCSTNSSNPSNLRCEASRLLFSGGLDYSLEQSQSQCFIESSTDPGLWHNELKDILLTRIIVPVFYDRYALHPEIMDFIFSRCKSMVKSQDHLWSITSIKRLRVRREQRLPSRNMGEIDLWMSCTILETTSEHTIMQIIVFDGSFQDNCIAVFDEIKFAKSREFLDLPLSSSWGLALRLSPKKKSDSIETIRTALWESISSHTVLRISGQSTDIRLSSLGLDSLSIIGLRNTLSSHFDVLLKSDFVLSNPTVEDVAQEILGMVSHSPAFRKHKNVSTLPKGFVSLNNIIEPRKLSLFLLHDITGTVLHLREIASFLDFPVFGIECDIEAVKSCCAEGGMRRLGSILAERIMQYSTDPASICIGGYSYGCRIAYSIAESLETMGVVVKIVLLDGAIDGCVQIGIDEVRRFAIEIYLSMNQLRLQRANLDLLVQQLRSSRFDSDLISNVDRLVGIHHGATLLIHLSIVEELCTLTSTYKSTFQMAGRALRIVSATADPLEVLSTREHIINLTVKNVPGSHFEFFRVDSMSVADAIREFLGDGEDNSGSVVVSLAQPSTDRRSSEGWYAEPLLNNLSMPIPTMFNCGRRGLAHLKLDAPVNSMLATSLMNFMIIDDRRFVEISKEMLTQADSSGYLVLEGMKPAEEQTLGMWLDDQLACIPIGVEFCRFDKARLELVFRFESLECFVSK